jgi:hypothetical protein
MADRPILFSGAMVRALLDGRKTQTRRVVKETTLPHLRREGDFHLRAGSGLLTRNYYFRVPYAVGDRLYVREAWRCGLVHDARAPRDMKPGSFIAYEADAPHDCASVHGRFRQGMHIPRWASRLTLTVTDVRVQRLQEISEQDAIDEGMWRCGEFWIYRDPDDVEEGDGYSTPRNAYRFLWEELNAERGFGWDVNPWIVAVSFTVERRNIDAVAA